MGEYTWFSSRSLNEESSVLQKEFVEFQGRVGKMCVMFILFCDEKWFVSLLLMGDFNPLSVSVRSSKILYALISIVCLCFPVWAMWIVARGRADFYFVKMPGFWLWFLLPVIKLLASRESLAYWGGGVGRIGIHVKIHKESDSEFYNYEESRLKVVRWSEIGSDSLFFCQLMLNTNILALFMVWNAKTKWPNKRKLVLRYNSESRIEPKDKEDQSMTSCGLAQQRDSWALINMDNR